MTIKSAEQFVLLRTSEDAALLQESGEFFFNI